MFHTDLKKSIWIEKLPPPVRPYIYLARLDRPAGIWLLLLPGWWAIVLASGGLFPMGARAWLIFALFGAGAVVMRGAGCVINDLWDRDLDRHVARTRFRPLASGAINARQGMIFLAVLLCMGLAILLQFNLTTIILGFCSLPLIVAYPLMKRWTWWPQAFLGLTFNFGALMGWAAMTDSMSLPAILLYASGIFWTLGYDTIYAHQDKEDDALIGVKSTALKFGAQSKIYVAGFYALAWVLIAGAGAFISLFTVFALLPAAAHLFFQIKRWDIHDPASALSVFKSNRDFGLMVLAGFALAGGI